MHTSPILHTHSKLPAAKSPPIIPILNILIYYIAAYIILAITAVFTLISLSKILMLITSPHGDFFAKLAWLVFLGVSGVVFACGLGGDLAFDILLDGLG